MNNRRLYSFRFSPIPAIRLLALFLFFLVSPPVLASDAATTYTIGIAPQQAASELAKRWIPIIQYWSTLSGIRLQFHTARDIDVFQKELGEGMYDIMFVNAYHYTVFHRQPGYVAFAADTNGSNNALLITRENSPITSLNQLDGAQIAFSSPAAVVGTWLPSQQLNNAGVKFVSSYVKSMDSVYLGVARNLFPAGGGEMRTFNSLDPDIRKELRVLWKSPPFPSHPFSAHPRVPRDVVMKLQKAMQDMNKTPEGLALLKNVKIQSLDPVTDRDYDNLRSLSIKPLEVK